MTGHSNAYIPRGTTSTLHVASDVKEEDGFLSGISTISTLAMALAAALAVILVAELIWRERRQRRREKRVRSAPETDPHGGDISP
ncbi:hypothetical protein ACPXCS_37880 [Streptomyces sp. DT190]|uniref:hypothetical protein n=1 Tax=unclassified Streptomyces TaxID=2593676 RepID=UPI003CF5A41F